MRQIEETVWQRMNGAVDWGCGYTQDQSATQWSLRTVATYTGQRYITSEEFPSQFETQENADDVNLQDVLDSHPDTEEPMDG